MFDAIKALEETRIIAKEIHFTQKYIPTSRLEFSPIITDEELKHLLWRCSTKERARKVLDEMYRRKIKIGPSLVRKPNHLIHR